MTEVRERILAERESEAPKEDIQRQNLLLFKTPDDGRMAMPLSMVARLEKFPRSLVEMAGEQEVVQYRGEILPLIHLTEALPERRQRLRNPEMPDPQRGTDTLQVVVYTYGDRSIGLVVDNIMDIVEHSLTLQRTGSREGVTGSAVIDNRVTELLDVEGVIRLVDPAFFEAQKILKGKNNQ
jgi:two-component system chemotaxis sensor kinase CheA